MVEIFVPYLRNMRKYLGAVISAPLIYPILNLTSNIQQDVKEIFYD